MRSYIYPLDVIRFLAAFFVMLFHLGFCTWATPESDIPQMFASSTSFPELASVAAFGWIGVEIFFVVSGFVIANSANNSSPSAFAKSRILRLYPAAWICSSITLSAWLLTGAQSVRISVDEYMRSTTLFIVGPWIDRSYWTLSVEILFYQLIFLLLLCGKFERLRTVTWLLTIASALYLVIGTIQPTITDFSLGSGALTFLVKTQLLYSCFFAIGIWMWFFSLGKFKATDFLGLSVAIVAGILEVDQRLVGSKLIGAPSSFYVVPNIVWIAALLIMFTVTRFPQRFTPPSPRGRETLKQIGQMTYPLYLVHAVFGAFVMRLMVGAGINRWVTLITALISMVVLSFTIARYVEPIVRQWLRGALTRASSVLRDMPMLGFLFRPGGSVAM